MSRIQAIKNYKLTQKQAYIIVFSLLAIWVLSAYAVMHKHIVEEAKFAKLINVSGKQRMLSQKIGMHSQLYYMYRNPEEKIKIQELVLTMREDHAFLLENLVSKELQDYYSPKEADIHRKVTYCMDEVDTFLQNTNEKNLKKITDCSQKILQILNKSVTLFQEESERGTAQMQKTEFWILMGTLLTLLLEAIFIVRPVLKRYVEAEIALDLANKEKVLQNELLEKQAKILNMNVIIDRYVITSTTDLNGLITDVSEAFCAISGYSKEELIGRSHNLIRHPDMPSEIYTQLWETITADQSWSGELKNRAKDGSFYWVHINISPLYDKHHKKIGYTAIREDITSHKLVIHEQEKLKALTLRMELALETGNIGVWEWCNLNDELVWDERMFSLYGTQEKESVTANKVLEHTLLAEDKRMIDDKLHHAIITNCKYDMEYWITTYEGHRKCIRSIGRCEKDHSDIIKGMVGINVDITDYKNNEDVLNSRVQEETLKRIDQEKMLVQQSKLAAMGEMMANIAHQWKQPLMMVSMGVLALQKKYKKGALDQDYMQNYGTKTNEIVNRMSQTIVDFSEYFTPNKSASNFSLSDCVRKSVSFLDPLIKKHSIVLRLDLSTEANIMSFDNELSQVILNLIKNSIDAIAEKNIENPMIEVSIKESLHEWMVHVLDNGGGIPEDILPRIFEPYFTTKFKSDGTGIGLYMSKMITEQSLHGKLEVINKNVGAQFTIKLPKE